MSEPVQLARAAREQLSAALNALQTSAVPDDLMALADPIADAMSVLHRVERSNGADLEGRDIALKSVRAALDGLQKISTNHPATDIVMEHVALSLAKVHALAKYQPPAAPAPVAAAAAQGPRGTQMIPGPAKSQPAAQQPQQAAYPAPQQQPQQPYPQQAPFAQPPQQASFAQPQQQAPFAQPPQQASFAQPQQQAPFAQPQQQAYVAPQPARPTPEPAPQARPVPQPAPQQAYAPVQPPQQNAYAPAQNPYSPAQQQQAQPQQSYAAPQPAPAPAPQPSPSRGGGSAPTGKGIDVELGTHSASNFYKGLGGNDVIEHGGIFVATYKVPKIGSTVALRLLLPGDLEFLANAVVQWTREAGSAGESSEPGFGARFVQITPEGRQLVYRYTRNREPIFYDDL